MADTLNQTQLAQIVSAPKAASQPFGKFDPAAKDRQLVNTFARRGFKDVVLMDRSDKSKPYNIRPYKAWIELGRVVRRGERGVRGLFHITQTDPIPAKPEMTTERKGMFRKAAKKLQPVKA
jgi:hypothetical protein